MKLWAGQNRGCSVHMEEFKHSWASARSLQWEGKRSFLLVAAAPGISEMTRIAQEASLKRAVSACEGVRWDMKGKALVVEDTRTIHALTCIQAETAMLAGISGMMLMSNV